ncbi:MAG: hypothetical protein H7833_12335 [Magnetococcus sp. DMHC-1]|nr:hypothetical protein [Magnetococcales bacterium]
MTISDKEIIPGLPIFLDLRQRACLVLGGEGEAVPKVGALLLAQAQVLILAEKIDPSLATRVADGSLQWSQEQFRPDHLNGIWFVLSTSTDPILNSTVQAEAQRRQIFMNVVDQRQYCSALWPAVIHRDPVTVAFSTGGASPALAGYLRRHIAKALPEHMGALATWLGAWRQTISTHLPNLSERGRFWQSILEGGVAERFLGGDMPGAEAMIRQKLQQVVQEELDATKKPGHF